MATKTGESENRDGELKHLGFVKIAAIRTLVLATNLYEHLKSNWGILGSGAAKIEGAVATVVSPLWQRLEGAGENLLFFFDGEVDEAASLYNRHAPPLVKSSVSLAQVSFGKLLQLVHVLTTTKAQSGSAPVRTKGLVSNCKQAVEEQLGRIWFGVNQVPLFHLVTNMAVSTAALWSEKYNHVVTDMSEKGYTIFSYVPLIQLERIAKALRRGGGEKRKRS